jgi:hypothetical protein
MKENIAPQGFTQGVRMLPEFYSQTKPLAQSSLVPGLFFNLIEVMQAIEHRICSPISAIRFSSKPPAE